MQKEFIIYEQALELKELGFNEPCFGYYDICDGYTIGYAFCYSDIENQPESGCSAPLKSQVFKWFREKGYVIAIHPTSHGDYTPYIFYQGKDMSSIAYFNTYENAEDFCIDKLIEIVKKNK